MEDSKAEVVVNDEAAFQKEGEESLVKRKMENKEDIETILTNETNLNENNKYDNNEEFKEIYEKIESVPTKDSFKKPVLIIGPRKGHPTKLKTLSQSAFADSHSNSEQTTNNNTKNELLHLIKERSEKLKSNVEAPKDNVLRLPYIEPSWSGVPERIYKLEVLKSGVIIETIDLSKKSFHVVGRLPDCDISLAHPSISRYHAILQYRVVADEKHEKGLYLYDLESTHRTLWNGNPIRPKVFVRLQGGHMIRFGGSQRKFIVQAPEDDQEQESEYSVTELKQMRKLELEERERLEKQQILEEEEEERQRKLKEENEGIDWGMGEDADEETDLTENPYAQTNNEELFLDDPKKTLRGWFEREGHELQYQTEDRGIGRFLCWVDLPIDSSTGRTVRAEVQVTGKKKEAVVQCALEACRVLDRYGLLRQANHEGRKRKTRNWEEEDFYDSDEDNFLDRTGSVERKREQRMRMAGKLDTKAETYDSLLKKYSKVSEKITNIENTIALQKLKQNDADDSNEDALDAFMSTLDTSVIDKAELKKMKIELLNLRKEETQLLKLINIAKPANLPPLKPQVSSSSKKSKDEFKDLKSIVGHKKKTKLTLQKNESCKEEEEEEEEEEERRSEAVEERLKEIPEGDKESEEENFKGNERLHFQEEAKEMNTEEETKSKNVEDRELDILKKRKRNMKRNQQRLEKAEKEMQKGYDDEEFREDYSMWVPPENQSGDGKTSLNEKFGY